jgi:hypothetical protein
VLRSGQYGLLSRPGLRFALSLLCLIACTWQGFVAHTHFHAHAPSAAACVSQLSPDALPSQTARLEGSCNSSDPGSDSSCPLCQIVLHGAASALPAHDQFTLPARIAGLPAATDPSCLTITAVSFDWNSRGPPLT